MLKALLSSSFLLLGAVSSGPVAAEVDLALVLAIDVSGSVSDNRFALQTQGYSRALRTPEFIEAVRAGRHRRIAVTFVEWSGARRQDQIIGWTLIDDEPGALSLADAIREAPRPQPPDWTSISGAIDFSVKLLAESGPRAARRMIDISGDGSNNDGRPITEARDAAVAAGITINGLPILAMEETLDAYYRENVIGGPGAFIVVARDFTSFPEAILKKLLTEVATAPRSDGG